MQQLMSFAQILLYNTMLWPAWKRQGLQNLDCWFESNQHHSNDKNLG